MTMTPSQLVAGYDRRCRMMLKLRGLSAAEAARQLGYPYTYSPPWLRGRAKPPLQVIPQLAGLLNCSPHWLLFGDACQSAEINSDADLQAAFQAKP